MSGGGGAEGGREAILATRLDGGDRGLLYSGGAGCGDDNSAPRRYGAHASQRVDE